MTSAASVTELLQALIRIPSVNPEGGQSPEISGEARCAAAVHDYLRFLGATAELQEVFPGRPNVVGHFAADKPGKPKLLLAPHTDTVTVDGMTVEPFGGIICDGKIYGRGACDTKGTMAAMLWALKEIGPEKLSRLEHEIWFAGLMGEETGQHGSKHLAKTFRPDFVLAGEPTDCRVVHVHSGCVRLRLITKGVAAHSSQPETGVNAIDRMLAVLAELKAQLDGEVRKYEDPVLGISTASLGLIRGGVRINIVPDHCEAEVDVRTVPAFAASGFPEALCAALKERHSELEIEISTSAPLFTDPEHPLVRKLASVGRGVTGARWFCDAAVFSAAGVPAVAAGPGCIAQAHTQDEFISVAALEEGVAFYRDFLLCC